MASTRCKVALVGNPGAIAALKVGEGTSHVQVSGKSELCGALAALRDPARVVEFFEPAGAGAQSRFRPGTRVLLTVDCTPCAVEVWENSGEEGSESFLREACHGADVVAVAFEVSVERAQELSTAVSRWMTAAKKLVPKVKGMKFPFVLVAVRTEQRYTELRSRDSPVPPPLNYSHGLGIGLKNKMPYFEVTVTESPVADVMGFWESVVRLGLRYVKSKDLIKASQKAEASAMQDHRARIKELLKQVKADAKREKVLEKKESKLLKREERQSRKRSGSAKNSPVPSPAPARAVAATQPPVSGGPAAASSSPGAAAAGPRSYPTLDGGLSLPLGWEMRRDAKNVWYFIDHVGKSSTYSDPRKAAASLGPLPPGWEQRLDPKGNPYFIDHTLKQSTYTDPRLNPAANSGARVSPAAASVESSRRLETNTNNKAASPAPPYGVASAPARTPGSVDARPSSLYEGISGIEIDVYENTKNVPAVDQTLRYEEYADREMRLLSFQNTSRGRWDHKRPTAEQCVAAGLFFAPTSSFPDQTKCFICGIAIKKWRPTDDPLVEHKKFKPNCPFVELSHSLGEKSTAHVPSAPAPKRDIPRAARSNLVHSEKITAQEKEINRLKADLRRAEAAEKKQKQAELKLEREREARLHEKQQRQHEQRQKASEQESLRAWQEAQEQDRKEMRAERLALKMEMESLKGKLAEAQKPQPAPRITPDAVPAVPRPKYAPAPKAGYASAPNASSSPNSTRNAYAPAPVSANSAGASPPGGYAGIPTFVADSALSQGSTSPQYSVMPSLAPERWSIDEVCSWLQAIDFGAGTDEPNKIYSRLFRENGISGVALMGLEANDLRDDLGVKSLGHRKILLASISKLGGRGGYSAAPLRAEPVAGPPDQAIAELRVDWSDITLGKKLGEGASGVVHKAEYRGQTVAVKLLKMQSFETSVMKELLLEATIMQQFQREDNPNIVKMFGMCLTPPNIAIVVEFYEMGALVDRFDVIEGWNDVFWLGGGIASGMKSMHDHNVVHRDLAARNVLLGVVDEKIIPRISDFGMSRYAVSNLQSTKTNHFALKWSAPESLKAFEYGKATDVWAFGITIMEMVNRGDPYPGIPDEMVAVRVRDQRFHPQLTVDTPDILADVLEACWATDPDDRPDFAQIVNAFDTLNR